MNGFLNKLSIVSAAAMFLVYIICAVAAGGNIVGLVCFNICLFVGIVSCGDMLKDILFSEGDLFEDIAISFCLGCIFLFVNYIVADSIGFQQAMIAIPLCIGGYNIYRKRNAVYKEIFARNNMWISFFTLAIFTFVFVMCALLPYATAGKVTNFFVHQDMMWSVGNTASVGLGFPLTDMRFANTTLNYHYLNDVTAGMLAVSSGQPAYESLCFYWYLPVAYLLIISLYQTTKAFCNSDMLARLMGLTVIFVSTGSGIFHYITNINGQGSATLVLCGGMGMLKIISDKKFDISQLNILKKAGFFISCFSVGFVISMYKSTIGALFILAVIAAAIVGFFTKQTKKEHLFFAAMIALGFAVAYKFIFSLAVNNLVFNGLSGVVNIIPSLVKMGGIGFIIYIPCLVYSLINFKKLSFLQLCVNAMFVGGAVAYNVYYHYSASQIYFMLIALPVMWLANSEFISKVILKKEKFNYIFIAIIVAAGAFNSLGLLDEARSGVQAGLRILNLRLSQYDESYATKDDWDAMVWLRENTDKDEIFATNRNNKYYQAGEGTFHYYTAVSQRACYLESYRYCMDYSGMYHEVRRRLEQVSDQIFHVYDEATAFETARTEGIDYLVVFTPVNIPEWQCEPVYTNSTVMIYKV